MTSLLVVFLACCFSIFLARNIMFARLLLVDAERVVALFGSLPEIRKMVLDVKKKV